MGHFFDLQHDLNQLAEEQLNDAPITRDLRALGLDPRAAYQLWIGQDFIAVRSSDDRSLQYYGGFEYVDKEFRVECGEYVFYSTDDNRVYDHHERYESDEPEICATCNGSGEGMYDGTRCSSCGGSGERKKEEN